MFLAITSTERRVAHRVTSANSVFPTKIPTKNSPDQSIWFGLLNFEK